MTPQEALRHFEKHLCKYCCEWDKLLRHCDTCPTDTAKKSLEKQIPKRVVTRTIYNKYLQQKETTRVCPVCGIDTPVPRELSSWEFWCPDCGQRIDWSKPKGDSYDFAIIDEVIAYDTQKKD